MASDLSADDRKALAKRGLALPDGSYPIPDLEHLKSAIQLRGHVPPAQAAALRALIIKRANELGHPELIPDDYKTTSKGQSTHAEPAGGVTTIRDVEILKVGNWHSGLSGRVPITDDDLDAMVQAATDAEIDQAPLKIGHVDPRFDGEPALGWLSNVRRQGSSLVADIADAPAKMADLIQTAFKRRSAEIAWGVKTPSGRTYKAALAGLALLGVTPPAIKGLADVTSRYSGAAEADSLERVTIIDGRDSELEELEASALSAQAAFEARKAFLAAGSRDTPQNVADTSSNATFSGGDSVPLTDDQVREQLGLPAETAVTDKLRDAAVALNQSAAAGAVEEAANAAAAGQTAPTSTSTPPPATDPAQPAPPAAQPPAAPATGLAAAPLVSVDSAAFAQLQADAAAGREAMRRIEADEREKTLQDALLSGRIAPANVDQWRAAYDANKEHTVNLLSGLPQAFSTVTQFSGATNATGKTVDENGFTEDDWARMQRELNL